MKTLDYEYDADRDVMVIEGIRYAGEVFRNFGQVMPVGATFLLQNRKDGVLTITVLSPAQD